MDMEQLDADMREASSIRYGVWLRLAVLDSGRWAVYHGTEPETGAKETGVIEIFNQLDLEYLKSLSLNEQARAEERYRRFRGEFEARETELPVGIQVAGQNLEEMGL